MPTFQKPRELPSVFDFAFQMNLVLVGINSAVERADLVVPVQSVEMDFFDVLSRFVPREHSHKLHLQFDASGNWLIKNKIY